ncbi:MAG: 16S rRNA (cytosine(1402)-N(4))-methyltransferase RsmH [Planctomycetota bacterium]
MDAGPDRKADPPPGGAGQDVGHQPVLLAEVMALLAPRPGERVVDCTLGRGGHAEALLRAVGANGAGGSLTGFDLDPENLAYARGRLEALVAQGGDCDGALLRLMHGSFANLATALSRDEKIDVLLADVGVASNQIDDPARGMSFRSADAPLDMRMDSSSPGPTAADLLAEAPVEQIADWLWRYGEERLSRRIARKIGEARAAEPIRTTGALSRLVRSCYGPGGRKQRIDPATRTFQALRIVVNGELESLERLLQGLPGRVANGARVGVIAFHSLEDRLVKQAMARWTDRGLGASARRKPVTATAEEVERNRRSRSAKLRVFRFDAGSADTAGPGTLG